MLARIYKITNTKTDKIYIGYTSQKYLSNRLNRHFYNARLHSNRYNSKLYNSMQKHSRDNFIIEEIYSSYDKEHTLKVIEPLLIKEFDSYNIGYNCSLGGEGRVDAKHSTETIAKMRISSTGKLHTEEDKLKISKGNMRTYKLTSLSGKEYLVHNLQAWCKTQNVNHSQLLKAKSMRRFGIAKVEKLPKVA